MSVIDLYLAFPFYYYLDDVEQQVCPVILDLSSPDSIDDFRTEAVAVRVSLFSLKVA